MGFDIKNLPIEEVALSILLKKKGLCSIELVDKTIAYKKKLNKEGKDKELEKILLQIRAITPIVLSELIPELNKMLSSVKICSHCKKKTFFSFVSCIHCNKELKLNEIFPSKREYYTTTKGEAPSCYNCKKQEWEKIPYCNDCGTSFKTNKPGPNSVICKSCDKTLKFNDAICSDCGTWSQAHKNLLAEKEGSWFKKNFGKTIFFLCMMVCFFIVRDSLFILMKIDMNTTQKETLLSEDAQLLLTLKRDKKKWSVSLGHINELKIEKAIELLSSMEKSSEIKDLLSIGHSYLAMESLINGSIIEARKHIYKSKELSADVFKEMFPKQQ